MLLLFQLPSNAHILCRNHFEWPTLDFNSKLKCGPMPNVMAAQPNIDGAFCESSVILLLVPCRKVWLMPAAGMPCSDTANIVERKTWMSREFCTCQNSVRDKSPRKCIRCVPAQEMAKYCAKFCWPAVSNITTVTKPRCETY